LSKVWVPGTRKARVLVSEVRLILFNWPGTNWGG
jgi:hypothetical protein